MLMDSPHVLFLQNQLCGRSWRAAKVLADKGHPVTLLAMGERSDNFDYSVFRARETLNVGRDIRSMVQNRLRIIDGIRDMVKRHDIDIIHSHNTPDNLSAWAARYLDVPVVHDVHDVQRLMPLTYGSIVTKPIIRYLHRSWERQACAKSDAVIVVSRQQHDHIRRFQPKRVIIIPNKAVQGPATPVAKLSETDGKVHLVYAGTFSLAPGSHRNFLADMELVAEGDIHVHVYPLTFDVEERRKLDRITEDHPNIHFHEPVKTTELVQELAQYDFGWLHFPVMTDNIRSASATKLYEYVLAGIPTIVNTEGRIADFVRRTGCGILVDKIEEAVPLVHERRTYPMPVDECRLDADHLLTLYREILAG